MAMAEEEGAQEPEQPQSQASGGFVSLEQARDIARDHARNNQDFYGRRYRRKQLVWDVVGQEERADGYYVRLSYQPARGFRGDAGVEEFTIERTGSVQSRRIVSEPKGRGKFLGCFLVALASAVLVAALLAGVLGALM